MNKTYTYFRFLGEDYGGFVPGYLFHVCTYFPVPAQALAAQVTQENFDKGLIYPPFSNIRKISAQIAANVAAKAYELGESFILIMQQLPYGEILN